MISIILDSSNTILCVALAKDNQYLDGVMYPAWQRQSELMVPEIDNLLKKYSLTRNDISEVIVAIGPGSYTGVRVALTIAKVMGVAINCAVYAVSSLEAQKIKDEPTICLINARNNRSYFGVYKNNEIIEKDKILTNDKVIEYINAHPTYKVTGELKYLDMEGSPYNLATGLLISKREENKVKEILALKPVYMKDEL